MKNLSLLSALTISCMFGLSACASQTNVVADAKTEQLEQSAMADVQNNVMLPEERSIILIGRNELDSAINAYGSQRYEEIFPTYSEKYNKFIKNPSTQTKDELMTFLRENEMFAQIVKPAPDSIFNSAKAKGLILMGYDGAECDYAKIEAYLDQKITDSKNGAGMLTMTN